MTDKLWRVLVRIIAIENNNIWLTIPGWNPLAAKCILKKEIPFETKVDQRLHVKCNLGTEDIKELYFQDWEEK